MYSYFPTSLGHSLLKRKLCLLLGKKRGGGGSEVLTSIYGLYRSYSRYFLRTRQNILEKTQNGPLSRILSEEIYLTINVQIIWMPLLKLLL